MTELKYSILKMLYNLPFRTSTEADIANSGLASSDLIYIAIKDLKKDGYIRQQQFSSTIELTDKGRRALERAAKNYQNCPKQNTNARKHDRLHNAIKIIPAAITVIASAIAIVEFIIRFS